MLHYIFALFFTLLSNPIFTGFSQPKIPQSQSSQNCSAILDSISKESKDKKEKIKQDLDKITVFIPTKKFYKKKLLDQAQANDQSISIPQFLKEEEEEEENDDEDDEKEIEKIAKIFQNILPANNSNLGVNNNVGITVNPNYGIGIVADEEQQNKNKTQLDVDLNLALHLDLDKNLGLIYSRHKDFCKDKEIIPDKDTSSNVSSSTYNPFLIDPKTIFGVCAIAGITCLIIKTVPVTVPLAVVATVASKNLKLDYAFCAPCDDFKTNQDQNLPIIWILPEENQSNSTKENIIDGLVNGTRITNPAGVTAGIVGAAGAAGLGLSIGLGSGAGTVAATAGGIVITGTFIPVIIGGAVVGYTVKLSIDAVRSLILHVKHKRAEKKAKKILEKNNAGGSSNGNNNNNKDPKDKKDKTPKPFIKKHPERTYEPNGNKHHPNAKNGIGKPSKNPVENLDKALNVPGEDFLITIEDDYYVMFREHLPGKYHDYIVENFKKLPQAARNALYNAGLVSDITKGKIK